jgi:hypothetical protein
MNIFYLHEDPATCAEYHCDKHVVKMILEYAQLLSTAHRVLDGTIYYETSERTGNMIKRYSLPDSRDFWLYKATHINHPSAVWVRKSVSNYIWLDDLFEKLLEEYKHRYGKVHKCAQLYYALHSQPDNIPIGPFTPPTLAMPEEHKVKESNRECYRDYYHTKHFAKWTNRETPEWFNEANK